MIRKAVYSGLWYPKSKEQIEEYIKPKTQKKNAIAVIVPHAGWIYSGKVAGEVFSKILPAPVYIIIGPNHYGTGKPLSIYPKGAWETPLGKLEIDEELSKSINDKISPDTLDTEAHMKEHSIEVQLPFIKYFSPESKIVAIAMSDYRPQTAEILGQAVSEAILESKNENFVLAASTDMSHYVNIETASRLDNLAIEKILNLDPQGLLEIVREKEISMCGSGPVASVLWASLKLGAKEAKLVKYTTSAEVTKDTSEVVAYAGIIIS